MDKSEIFNKLKAGVGDLASFYGIDPSPENREILEAHILSLQTIGAKLGIKTPEVDNVDFKAKIQVLLGSAAAKLQQAPTIKNLHAYIGLVKLLTKL